MKRGPGDDIRLQQYHLNHQKSVRQFKRFQSVMKYFLQAILLFSLSFISLPSFALSDIESSDEYERLKNSFSNFITCELTRSDPVDYFNGKQYKVIVVNLFDAVDEGDIRIVSGSVKCWVENKYEMMYIAVGLKKLMGKEKVYYFVARHSDFEILATELMNYPYKERCQWDRYWIDLK